MRRVAERLGLNQQRLIERYPEVRSKAAHRLLVPVSLKGRPLETSSRGMGSGVLLTPRQIDGDASSRGAGGFVFGTGMPAASRNRFAAFDREVEFGSADVG